MQLIESFKQSKYYNLDTLLNVLVVLNALFVVKILYYVLFLHHLPPPFYYDPNNTFFDFFEIGRMSFNADLFSALVLITYLLSLGWDNYLAP